MRVFRELCFQLRVPPLELKVARVQFAVFDLQSFNLRLESSNVVGQTFKLAKLLIWVRRVVQSPVPESLFK